MSEASIEASALYLDRPFFGSRRMAVTLGVGRTRIRRLMRIPRIEAYYLKHKFAPRVAMVHLSRPVPGHEIYPYLLRGVSIEQPNQVWSTDITYLPMHGGFLYLVAVNGLVQPFRDRLGTLQHHGDRLLSDGVGGGIPLRPTRNLELGSRLAVHAAEFLMP
jgi:transposase InsO family protein